MTLFLHFSFNEEPKLRRPWCNKVWGDAQRWFCWREIFALAFIFYQTGVKLFPFSPLCSWPLFEDQMYNSVKIRNDVGYWFTFLNVHLSSVVYNKVFILQGIKSTNEMCVFKNAKTICLFPSQLYWFLSLRLDYTTNKWSILLFNRTPFFTLKPMIHSYLQLQPTAFSFSFCLLKKYIKARVSRDMSVSPSINVKYVDRFKHEISLFWWVKCTLSSWCLCGFTWYAFT